MVDKPVRRRVIVTGRVQGVWFRDSTRGEAVRLGLNGWVRNLADGSVEAVFEGPAEQVESAVRWVHRGPERAVVDTVTVVSEAPEGLTEFRITH